MAHLNPVPLAEVKDDDIRERFEHYKKTRGFTPNSIMTMVRRPNIVRAFMALNQAVLYEGTVPEETKMLVSVACSYAAGCLYCQSHMTNLASLYKALRREDRGAVGFRAQHAVQRRRTCRHPPGAEGRRGAERGRRGRF